MGMDTAASRRWRLAPDFRPRFEAHFGDVEQCLLQALHSLALQAHAHVLCAYYAPHEDTPVVEPAFAAQQLLERVLACLAPIAAATAAPSPRAAYKSMFLQVAAWYARKTEINPLPELRSVPTGAGA